MADLVVTPANVAKVSGTTQTKIAGATITAGQTLYEDPTDSFSLKPAQGNAAATDKVAGIALHGASDGQPITFQSDGDIDLGATLTVGTIYVLSAASAGGIAPAADLASTNYVSVLGIATAADNLQMGINNSGAQVP